MTDRTLKAARAYTARGLRVIPLRGKIPATEHGVHDATSDLPTITRWFEHTYTDIGIAIPAGVLVVDVDPRNGGDQSFARLIDEHSDSWTWHAPVQRTGGNGHHLWFAYPGDTLRKNHPDLPGIDILTAGRYVVAAPTHTDQPYRWERPLPDQLTRLPPAPHWLLELYAPIPAVVRTTPIVDGPDPLGTAARTYMGTWAQLLTRHGWTLVAGDGDTDGSKWRHPASTNPFSATIRHGVLFCYSPNTGLPVTEPGDPHGITPYRALELLDFHGDRTATIRALRDAGHLTDPTMPPVDWARRTTDDPDDPDDPEPAGLHRYRIAWPDLWALDDNVDDRWLCEPLFALGRAHALYAKAKTGKSLLVFEAAVALATGRPFLHKPATDPVTVLYADYEMTAADVRERLEKFGYGPDDDLSRLHYLFMPALVALDTVEGGNLIAAHAVEIGAQLVIIDTTARSVQGEEDRADTFRSFSRYTGMALKRAGVTWVRIDHAGKNLERGARGSSAKADDVDVVWQLDAKDTDAGRTYTLKATHQRMGWVPHKVDLRLVEDLDAGRANFRMVDGLPQWPARTKECADALDAAAVPLDSTVTDAIAALAGIADAPRRREVVVAALRFRKEREAPLEWARDARNRSRNRLSTGQEP